MEIRSNQIRTLFSRKHKIVYAKLGVFLGGPTPPDGQMLMGWRRKIVNYLLADNRLDASMLVVAPEPKSGYWSEVDGENPDRDNQQLFKSQMAWELQYLKLCDITTFWLPTYWNKETAGIFAPNIGPTTRWEFGYFLQEYLKNKTQKRFIVGGPEDAQNLEWAKVMAAQHNIPWHTLNIENKDKLVAESFLNAITEALLEHN